MTNYIDILKLERHVEGGYFTTFYKSSDKIIFLNKRYNSTGSVDCQEQYIERYASSSIYFMLEKKDFSAWHRLKSDEIWHYYDGKSPIDIYVIDKGELKTYTLGNPSVTENATFQVVIPAGVLFAAELRDKSSFGLVGCTVSPAFEYDDFELVTDREQLLKLYPNLIDVIDKFIRSDSKNLYKSTHERNVGDKNKLTAEDYIEKFKMEKHQEGGYFSLTYKSTDVVIPLDPRYAKKDTELKIKHSLLENQRFAGSAIYFLLNKDDFSAWHQLKSDEIWHYYDGNSPIDIHIIDKNGNIKTSTLGNPILMEQASFQVVIKAGEWFAAEVRNKESFALVGCTVSPAFEYNDFTLGNRKELISRFPLYKALINKFTRISPEEHKSWTSKAITYANLVSGIGFYTLTKGKETLNNCLNGIKFKIGM